MNELNIRLDQRKEAKPDRRTLLDDDGWDTPEEEIRVNKAIRTYNCCENDCSDGCGCNCNCNDGSDTNENCGCKRGPKECRHHESDDCRKGPKECRHHENDDCRKDPKECRRHDNDDCRKDPKECRHHENDDCPRGPKECRCRETCGCLDDRYKDPCECENDCHRPSDKCENNCWNQPCGCQDHCDSTDDCNENWGCQDGNWGCNCDWHNEGNCEEDLDFTNDQNWDLDSQLPEQQGRVVVYEKRKECITRQKPCHKNNECEVYRQWSVTVRVTKK